MEQSPHIRIVAFALWGPSNRYLRGALQNAKLVQEHYPGWHWRIYCGADVPKDHIQKLHDAGFQVIHRIAASLHEGLFWRFEPASEPGVDMLLSRDCDSRVNPREAAAVNEWIASGLRLHTMRDHYEHTVPILGGMWGCRHWPQFKGYLASWLNTHNIGQMGDDQEFLKQSIWPQVKDTDCIQHDRYIEDTLVNTPKGPFLYRPATFFGGSNLRPFPPHAPLANEHGKHVGSRV